MRMTKRARSQNDFCHSLSLTAQYITALLPPRGQDQDAATAAAFLRCLGFNAAPRRYAGLPLALIPLGLHLVLQQSAVHSPFASEAAAPSAAMAADAVAAAAAAAEVGVWYAELPPDLQQPPHGGGGSGAGTTAAAGRGRAADMLVRACVPQAGIL